MTFLLLIASLILPPCAAEDSMNCVWIADVAGNGAGTSFVDVGGVAYTFEKEF